MSEDKGKQVENEKSDENEEEEFDFDEWWAEVKEKVKETWDSGWKGKTSLIAIAYLSISLTFSFLCGGSDSSELISKTGEVYTFTHEEAVEWAKGIAGDNYGGTIESAFGPLGSDDYSEAQRKALFKRDYKGKYYLIDTNIHRIREEVFGDGAFIQINASAGHNIDLKGSYDILDFEEGQRIVAVGRFSEYGSGLMIPHVISYCRIKQ